MEGIGLKAVTTGIAVVLGVVGAIMFVGILAGVAMNPKNWKNRRAARA